MQTIQKAIDTLNDFLNPLVCSKDEKELQEPTWPQNPIISLTTACDFFLNYMGAEHLWIPFKEHLPYVNDIPEDVEYHRCSSVPQTCMNHAKKIGKLDEFYDIFWAMWVWHILCIWGSRQNDLPDPLTAWADHMLGCYNIRPVPDENDETWQHLKGMVETLPEMFYSTPYIGHSLAWEKYFHPQEKSVEALIKRKPRCKPIQGESGEKWEERSTKDYWLKTAMIALKIARGEVIRDGLSGLIPVGGKNYLPEVDNEDEDMPQHRKLKPENRFYFEEITNDRAALYVQRFHLPEGEKTQREKTQEYLESTGEGEEDY